MQTIYQKTLSDVMSCGDTPVLTYSINYPQFTTTCALGTAEKVNCYYESEAKKLETYCRTVLYPQAVEQVLYAMNNQFPFQAYEILTTYQITYNEKCITSLFSDQYSYLGGAHGNTTRLSQTWDFCTGTQLNLIGFFFGDPGFTDYIFASIEQQIADQLVTDPDTFFDDYKNLIRGNFNMSSFYLKPDGLVIYYQQYDIAPYVRGIPEFFFPFAKKNF